MTDFVLVHGAWHDGTTLGPVADELRRHGHRVYTPTMAGHGPGADTDVSLEDGVNSIVRCYLEHDLFDTVLVGHSFGGTVIARVSEELPERIASLVFWSAFVPQRGHNVLDETGIAYSADEWLTGADSLSFERWRSLFIQDADDELAASTFALLSPEPRRPKVERLDLRRFYASGIPRHYIDAVDDRALASGLDRNAMIPRLGEVTVHRIRGSHEVLFTDPGSVADALLRAARA